MIIIMNDPKLEIVHNHSSASVSGFWNIFNQRGTVTKYKTHQVKYIFSNEKLQQKKIGLRRLFRDLNLKYFGYR